MVQKNILDTFIHHKFLMQTHRLENLFSASNSFKYLCFDLFSFLTNLHYVTILLIFAVNRIVCGGFVAENRGLKVADKNTQVNWGVLEAYPSWYPNPFHVPALPASSSYSVYAL